MALTKQKFIYVKPKSTDAEEKFDCYMNVRALGFNSR